MEGQERKYFGRYTAEFNTGQDSLEQLAVIEWTIDNLFVEIWESIRTQGDLTKIHALYDWVLRVYYKRLFSMMWERTQKWFEKGEEMEKEKDEDGKEKNVWVKKTDVCAEGIKKLYFEWQKPENRRKVPMNLIEKMEKFHRDLLECKQKQMNLGIPMRKEQKLSEKLNKI